jgi:hypothetical protein
MNHQSFLHSLAETMRAPFKIVVDSTSLCITYLQDRNKTATLPISRPGMIEKAKIGDKIHVGLHPWSSMTLGDERTSTTMEVVAIKPSYLICRALCASFILVVGIGMMMRVSNVSSFYCAETQTYVCVSAH